MNSTKIWRISANPVFMLFPTAFLQFLGDFFGEAIGARVGEEILPRRGDSHGLTSTPSNDASSRSSPLSQCKTRAVDLMVLVVVRS